LRRFFVGVNPDATEIVTEARLEKAAGGFIEGLTGGTKDVMHDGRSDAATLW
jgi:hypothetical protein